MTVTGTVEEFVPGGASSGNLSITQLSGAGIEVTGTTGLPLPGRDRRGGTQPDPTTVISDDELPVDLREVPGVLIPMTTRSTSGSRSKRCSSRSTAR